MKIRHLGYACINDTLNKMEGVRVTRTMRKKTFEEKGVTYAEKLIIENLDDLEKILKWNVERGIYFYRMSSGMFNWIETKEQLLALPKAKTIVKKLEKLGEFIRAHNIRIGVHPGAHCRIFSLNEEVVDRSFIELRFWSFIIDTMRIHGGDTTINIHLNITKENLEEVKENINNHVKSYQAKFLHEDFMGLLTLENDDNPNLIGTELLVDFVKFLRKRNIIRDWGVPVVFDFHHEKLYNPTLQGEELEEHLMKMAKLSISTWKSRIFHRTPKMHWSESLRDEKKDPTIKINAHSMFTYGPLPFINDPNSEVEIDLMIEAKMKEKNIWLLKDKSGNLVQPYTYNKLSEEEKDE